MSHRCSGELSLAPPRSAAVTEAMATCCVRGCCTTQLQSSTSLVAKSQTCLTWRCQDATYHRKSRQLQTASHPRSCSAWTCSRPSGGARPAMEAALQLEKMLAGGRSNARAADEHGAGTRSCSCATASCSCAPRARAGWS